MWRELCCVCQGMQKAVGLSQTAQRGLVVGGVVMAHLGLLLLRSPATPPALPPEMAVSVVTEPTMPLAAPTHTIPSITRPVVRITPPSPTPTAAPTLPTPIATPPALSNAPVAPSALPTPNVPIQAAAVVSPVLPDRAPDYQARYLNNPQPVYPAMAVRMGWQGKVILSVEVLRDGRAGQVSVQRSSGHSVLDDAALQAVRSWRFVAARRDGQLVDQVFFVPLPFILKDSDE